MKLFSRILAGALSAIIAAGMLPGAALAEETALYTFFHDKKADSGVWSSGNYVDEQGRGSYISEMDDTTAAKEGSGSYRIKLNTPYGTNADLENLTMLHANIVGNPKAYTPQAGDYLTLWYQPLLKREKIEVGIASENGGKYTMLRVNLLDYIQIQDSEYADSTDTVWKQVKIPMTDFLDSQKAVFYDNGTGMEEFNWSRLAGFSIAGSDENLTEQVNFCRVDEVKIIQENSGEGPSDPEDQEYPQGETLYSYYEDGFISGKTWVNAIGNEYISQVEDAAPAYPVKEGSKSWRIKLSVPEDYESDGSMLYANIVTPPGAYAPSADDYLVFWYQPLLKRDKLEAGLACDGGDGKYAMLRVDLSKYMTIDASDYNNTSVWKLVKIPVSDLMGDSAVFYANGTGLSEFNWDRMTGFSFAASDEGLTTSQQHLCRLDAVKIVKSGSGGEEPEEPSDQEYPQGETLYSYYENEFTSGKTWVNAIGNEYISQVEDAAPAYPVKEGSKSWRIKLSVPEGYESNGSMLYVNIVTPPGAYTPSKDDYLAFWYQPLLKRSKLEAGLACDGGDGKYAMLRVDLSKYMTIDASDYNDASVWKLVKIPVSDLMDDSAVFYANGTGLSEFNWERLTGFSFAASDEGLTTSQQHLCRLDEIKIVRSGNGGGEPEAPVDPEYPKGEVKHVFFDDKCNGWGSATPTFVSMITTPDTTEKKEGTASQRIKIGGTGYVNTGDMLYASIVNNSIPADVKTAVQEPGYLAFWYQPLLKREKIEVGFASGQVGGGQNSYAMLRVNLLDYVTINESEWGTNVWKLVKIPLEDFQDPDKAVFDANGTNFEAFDWSQLVGFSIAVSDEGALTGQPNLCRLDEIKVVGEDPIAPEKPEITLTKAAFYDGNGSEITSLSGVGSVSAKLTFENTSQTPVSGVSVMLAVYDGQGTLTQLVLKKVTVPAGTANLQTDTVSVSDTDSVVKIIGLDDMKGMHPIAAADGAVLSIVR